MDTYALVPTDAVTWGPESDAVSCSCNCRKEGGVCIYICVCLCVCVYYNHLAHTVLF